MLRSRSFSSDVLLTEVEKAPVGEMLTSGGDARYCNELRLKSCSR